MKLDRGSETQLGRMILRGTVRMIGGRVARIAITLIGISVLSRLLTPSDFGVIAVAAVILPLANALLEGLIDVPTIREDSLDRAGLGNLIWIGVCLMAIVCAALWLSAPALAVLLNAPLLAEVLRVLCFGLFLQPFIVASHAFLRRQHRFGASSIFMPISGAVYVLSAIGFALLDFGVWSLVFGQIISLVITALGLGLSAGIPFLPPRRLQARVAWQLGGLGLLTRLLAWTSANIDTLFASAALGSANTGIYSRAYNITTQMKEPFAVLDQTVRQAFVAQRSLDDVAASRATLNGLRLVVLAASLVAASAIVMREAIVAVLLGAQWTAVVTPLAILTASLPARIARLYLDGFTYARGSMLHMLVRNVAIVILLTGGLWLWAGKGVEVIALLVAVVQVVTLFFRGGAMDVLVAGTMAKRLAAFYPGFAAGLFVVFAGEIAAAALPEEAGIVGWSVQAVVCGLACILIVTILPRHWMPDAWHRAKQNIFKS